MDQLTEIPVKPVKTAREICEEIFKHFRESEHLGYVDFMVMAYTKAAADMSTAASDAFAKGYLQGYNNAADSALFIADNLKRASLERSRPATDETNRRAACLEAGVKPYGEL